MQCTAKNKSGNPCKQHAINGTTKCYLHGGKSLAGIASPSLKHGRYSKHLPERLAGRYNEALADPKLMELRDEIALMGARLAELVGRVEAGDSTGRWKALQAAFADLRDATRRADKPGVTFAMAALENAIKSGGNDYATWREIAELTEQRRKLVESEQKRLVAMQQMITSEQAMILLAAITDTVRKHVTDKSALAAISTELKQLTIINPG